MLFWIVAGLLAALVAVLLARPLLRPGAEAPRLAPDQAIYRDQLAEVDRDLARGVLAPGEGERARTEIARRLLAADRAGSATLREAPRRAALVMAGVSALLVVMGSLLLYATLGHPGDRDLPRAQRLAEAERLYASRPSQAEAEAELADSLPADLPEPPEDVRATIEQLRAAAQSGEADADSLIFLAFVEMRLGNAAEAARVQKLALDKKGAEATLEDRARLLDYMVAAAQGRVTPEAETVLAGMRESDDMNPAVLYYSGLLFATTGRPDEAFPFWRALVEKAPAEDPYRQMAAGAVEDLAWMAGVDYTLPTPASAGPTPEQMAAAADMPPEEREQMIRGMVDQLSARLASGGGPPEDWARLISSLGVLGDTEQASAILAEARTAFSASPEAQELLDGAAQSAGLAP
jgi:cytochrome c-type biogenesis protein CcmH